MALSPISICAHRAYGTSVSEPNQSSRQWLKPLSVLLDVHDAPKTREHGRDVQKVVLHGVLPSGASLKGLVELCLFSLQDYEFMITKTRK